MARYQFRNARSLTRAEDLDPLDRARLPVAFERYDGEALAFEERLAFDASRDALTLDDARLRTWEVLEDGRHAYDLWRYATDSGVIFHAASTEVFGDVIQFGFGGPGGEPNEVAEAIGEAFNRGAPAAT